MAQAAVSRIVPVKEILDKYKKSDIIMAYFLLTIIIISLFLDGK